MSLTSYPIRYLDWDSKLFGIKMGEVELSPHLETGFKEKLWLATLKNAAVDDYQFLQCRFDAKQHRLCNFLLGNGATLGDVLVTFKLKLNPAAAPPSPGKRYQVRVGTVTDLPDILTIAGSSFNNSRIFQDPHFDLQKAQRFYTKWIEDCMGRSENVLVVQEGPVLKGFVSLQLNKEDKTSVIRLLAVNGSERGKGMGRILINAAIRNAIEENMTFIQVGTQVNNYPAIRLYEKSGFAIDRVRYRMHLWLNDPRFKAKLLIPSLAFALSSLAGMLSPLLD